MDENNVGEERREQRKRDRVCDAAKALLGYALPCSSQGSGEDGGENKDEEGQQDDAEQDRLHIKGAF